MLFKVVDVVFAALKNFCFTGDMEVLTRRGWVRWDELQAGDEVASRHEDIPDGAIEYRPVQVVWELKAPIWHVHVGGEVVRTTGEHPFYVLGEGWVPARALRPGDTLLSHDGQRVSVEEVFPTGLEEPVYNAMIADFHTYFVSKSHWTFSVWAHNAGCKQKEVLDASGGTDKLKVGEANHAAGLINKGKLDEAKVYLAKKGVDADSPAVTNLLKKHGYVPPAAAIPRHAEQTLQAIRNNNANAGPAGYRGGGTFQNDGRGNGQVLDKVKPDGTPITYKEFDVHPYTPGVSRGSERIVVGTDGKAYFTNDHYKTFIEMN